jgi:hemolysin activation/secretion protein
LALGLAAAGVLLASGAHAQTASQITPPSFRPPLQTGPAGVAVPEDPSLATPQGADRLPLTLAKVTVEGGRPEMAARTQAITRGLTGRTITAADVFDAARRLETAYARAGYVLARVVLPAQNLDDGGRLTLIVVDGHIERIDAETLPPRLRKRVLNTLTPLIGQSGLRLSELERRLLLAGDIAGARLRSTLAAGSVRGASVLIIDGDYRPITGQLTFDNNSSSALGDWSAGLGLDANNLLGLGELVYLRAGGLPEGGDDGYVSRDPRSRTLSAGLVLPVGLDGLSMNLEATQTRANPSHPPLTIGFGSVFERYSLRLRYPFVRGRNLTLSGEMTFDAQNDDLYVVFPVTVPIAKDRLRIVRAGIDGAWFTPANGVLSGSARLSQGLTGFGARTAEDATPLLPLSRLGADADFHKLEYSLAYSYPVTPHLNLDLNVRGQTSFGEPLPQSEQLGVATPTALSAFDAGSLQGDAGFALRGQASSPWSARRARGAVSFTPYVFGAVGQLWLERPTVFERERTSVGAYGVGVRLTAGLTGGSGVASLALEWGQQHRDDNRPTNDRLSLTGAVQF